MAIVIQASGGVVSKQTKEFKAVNEMIEGNAAFVVVFNETEDALVTRGIVHGNFTKDATYMILSMMRDSFGVEVTNNTIKKYLKKQIDEVFRDMKEKRVSKEKGGSDHGSDL